MNKASKGYEYDRIADIKRMDFITNSLKSCIPANGKILDVGCGNGVISRHLGQFGYQVHGIDVSEKTIETARSLNMFENVKFDVLSAEELVASGTKYDAIVCSEVLEHLHEPSSLLRVLFLSLKDNGKLVVTVPNGRGPRETLVTRPILRLRQKDNVMWRWVLKLKDGLGYGGTTAQSAADNLDHVQFFSKKDLQSLSASNHFRIVKFGKANFIEDVFPFSFFTKRVKALQKLDCKVADMLPYQFTGGFFTVWEKSGKAPLE
jgi:SAM-dependent methyltransferase